jgi:hypothetical protein
MNPNMARIMLAAGKSVVPFSPLDIANLGLWLDGADTSPSNIVITGGVVSQWTDKSSSGWHATQSTAGQRPTSGTRNINGKNVIDFDGSDDNLVLPSGSWNISNANSTLFFVYASDNTSSAMRVVSGRTGGASRYGVVTNNGGANLVGFTSSSAGTSINIAQTWVASAPHMLVGRRNGTTQQAWNDAGTTGSNASGSSFVMTGFGLGRFAAASGVFDGVMGELIIYLRALSNAEINQVATWLDNKWNTGWSAI